ncbi:MAG: hypothetical protein QUT30_05765 [Acidobacteriota bacterium]|nr:hypothetical protein [Acidobacteriota bacterium]
MIKPFEITGNIANLLKSIDGLVAAMGGDMDRIYVYDDTYPINVSLSRALHAMPSPGIMVRYRGLSESSAGWKFSHTVSIYLRPRCGDTYSNLVYLLMSGIPAGRDQEFPDCTIHDGLNLPRFEGEITPQQDAEGVEYLEINLRLEER